MKRASPPNFDQNAFKQALSQFATGVTVITTRAESGQLIGITASSFNSVSLNPPLVLWSLATRSASMPVFRANSHYVVNVLAGSQLDLCKRFATVKGIASKACRTRKAIPACRCSTARSPGSNAITAAATKKATT